MDGTRGQKEVHAAESANRPPKRPNDVSVKSSQRHSGTIDNSEPISKRRRVD